MGWDGWMGWDGSPGGPRYRAPTVLKSCLCRALDTDKVFIFQYLLNLSCLAGCEFAEFRRGG